MSAIKLKLGTNTDKRTVIVDGAMTPKEIFLDNDIDFASATIHLDGAALTSTQMNSSIETLGATDNSFLIAVVKMNNA